MDRKSGLQVYLHLLSYVKPYWKFFALSILGFLIYSGTQPALAWITGWLAKAVYEPDPYSKYLIPLSLIGIYLMRGIGGFLGSYFLAKVSQNVIHTLRCEMFNHQLTLPNQYYDNSNSGHLISRITFNVNQVTGAATDAIKVVVREGIAVIALLGTLFYLNWMLSLIFLAIAPVIGLVVNFASKRFRKISKNIQVSMGDITHVTSEAINGFQEVKSFGGEKYEKQRFSWASQDNLKQNLKLVRTTAINTPILQMIVAVALSFLLYLGLEFLDRMTPEAFVTYMTAAGLLPKPIRQISEVNATIQKGIAAAESIFELLDAEPEKESGTKEISRVKGQLEFRNLNFSYPDSDIKVLKDINLTIKPGENVALVGRSGSGKSTLASLIPRFYDDYQGQILLDSENLPTFKLTNLRSQIALVTQQVTLFNDSVSRNIAYGALADASEDQIKQAADAAYALEFIEKLPEGFDTLVGEDGVLLSGGQRQRLAIARALLKNAPILIMDEATSALDTESEKEIQGAMEHVMEGRTTLVIAHRLSTIEKADKIVVMDQGRIVEMGTHDELLAKQGQYYQLYQIQFDEDKDIG